MPLLLSWTPLSRLSLRRQRQLWHALTGLTALTCSLVLTACSASKVNLGVYLSPELEQTYGEVPTLEVDVAGVTAKQKQMLESSSIEQYFAPNSALRRSVLPVTLLFSPLQQRPYVLEKSFIAWDAWKQRGAEYVAVLCNLPQLQGKTNGQGGNATGGGGAASDDGGGDGRMLFINMHDGWLKDSSSHTIEITAAGVIKVEDEPEIETDAATTENQSQQQVNAAIAKAMAPSTPQDPTPLTAGEDGGVFFENAGAEDSSSNTTDPIVLE